MKTVHIGYEHSAQDVRIFLKECRTLSKAGHEVIYVTSNKHDVAGDNIIDGIRVITLPVKEKRGFRRVWRYFQDVYYKCIELDADVYHVHEYTLIPVAKKLCARGKRIIYDTHECYAEAMYGKVHSFPCVKYAISKLVELYERSLINKSCALICAVPSEFERRKIYNSNNCLLMNYPVLDELDVNLDNYPERAAIACYTGIISKERGAEVILEAFSEMDAELLLAGSVSSGFLQELKKMRGWQKAIFMGHLPRQKMIDDIWSKAITGIVVFLPLPSYTDAVPNKLFEYMSAGLPVIASNFDAWSAIVQKHQCGICVDPTNPEEISHAFSTINNDRQLSMRMGANGKKAIRDEYNWDSEGTKLVQLYIRICGMSGEKASCR